MTQASQKINHKPEKKNQIKWHLRDILTVIRVSYLGLDSKTLLRD